MIRLCIRRFSTVGYNKLKLPKSEQTTNTNMVRVLNVAEKNDAAKSLADIMSRGGFRKREGFSKFNKIYEYDYMLFNQNVTMTMTSVSGHLLGFEFVGQYRKWNGCNPAALFDAPVQKMCPENYSEIKRTLEREARGCQSLVIWTDGDREGENIGFEIIQVCQQIKPNIRVYRARFSEITPQAVTRAIANLAPADQNTSDAVDVRQELDLRIGAAFTRFQTLRLKKVFPEVLAEQLISYGSCQFPTLGFVVERYKQVQAFIPEPFWKIRVAHEHEEGHVEFTWKRQRLFDHLACLVLYEHCLESPEANVLDVKSKPKSKWRPNALDTVELEKCASRKLRINAKETMKIAEKLYTQGFISYPRTETNIFPKDLNLANLVQQQANDPQWGDFAQRVLQRGPTPRNGNKTDQAHPPIHPTKYAPNLQGNEKKVYEFIVRHFLACCSQDAQGQETIVDIAINDEQFSASGLMILAKNYLEVYIYDKWNAKIIPTYSPGETFLPSVLEMTDGETSPPPLLTEADLIALMDKHGIGTDATHADHIETIKSRMYVGVRPDGRFVPGELGMGLVEGYDAMGFEMSKPHLRAGLEADLQRICEGRKDKNAVLREQVENYRHVFLQATEQAQKIDEALGEYFGNAQPYTADDIETMTPVYRCPKCGCDVVIKQKKEGHGYFLSCTGYPNCREAVWFPDFVLAASVSDSVCNSCQPGPRKKIKFKFKRGSVPMYIPIEYEACIGCDDTLKEVMQVSGFSSGRSNNSQGNTQSRPNTQQTRHHSTSTTRPPLSAHNTGPGVLPSRGNPSRGRGGENTRPGRGNPPGPPMDPPRDPPGGGPPPGQGGGAVVCNCGEDARQLTVRKEGNNKGRQFYGCSRPQDASCGFFLWADEGPSTSNEHNPPSDHTAGPGRGGGGARDWNSHNSGTMGGDGEVQCNCGTPAKSLTVQKEGANKGRPFFACPKPMGQGCGFFQWGDEAEGGAGAGGSSWTPAPRGRGAAGRGSRGARGGGGGPRGGGGPQGAGGVKRKRHCGVCGEPGHTRKTCPSAS